MMMGGMGLWMLLPLLLLVVVVAGGAYLAVRTLRSVGPEGQEARALLERRLALGEISPEDYFERESALRSSARVPRRRKRR